MTIVQCIKNRIELQCIKNFVWIILKSGNYAKIDQWTILWIENDSKKKLHIKKCSLKKMDIIKPFDVFVWYLSIFLPIRMEKSAMSMSSIEF